MKKKNDIAPIKYLFGIICNLILVPTTETHFFHNSVYKSHPIQAGVRGGYGSNYSHPPLIICHMGSL
jgi:hypothetical protein